MSELNRLLSDLSSRDDKNNKVMLVTIPGNWGFRFARLFLALFATLAGASSIAWAISNADFKKLGSHFSVSALLQDERQTSNLGHGVPGMPRPASTQATQILAQLSDPIDVFETLPNHIRTDSSNIQKIQQIREVKVQEEEPASFHVESVNLSAAQLSTLAYENAQKRATEGDMKKAISHLYDAVEYNPRHLSAINQLAGLLFAREQIREAEAVLRKGISMTPLSSTLRVTLARIYQQTNREESALIVLIAAEDLLKGDAIRLVSMRAALAQKLEKHDLAKESYRWLTEKEPMDGRWWLGFAVSAEREKEYKDAEKAYQKSVTAGGLSDQAVAFARQRLLYLQSVTKGEVKNGN